MDILHIYLTCWRMKLMLYERQQQPVPYLSPTGAKPHVGLAQGHIGRYVQDPRGGQVVQFQAIELQ
jgi:hypothetical protein